MVQCQPLSSVPIIGVKERIYPLARSLTSGVSGIRARVYDLNLESVISPSPEGVQLANSISEAISGSSLVIIAVTHSLHVDDILFGKHLVASTISEGSVIILCSTLTPTFVQGLNNRLTAAGRGLQLVDVCIELVNDIPTILASGSRAALFQSDLVLKAMAARMSVVGWEPGQASFVSTVIRMLEGVHVASAAEAMALGAKSGLDTRQLYRIITTAAGNSAMFQDRVPHMLTGEFYPRRSSLGTMTADLGFVLEEARRLRFPTPLTAAAHQQFLYGSLAGFAEDDDTSIFKIWSRLGSIHISLTKSAPLVPSGDLGSFLNPAEDFPKPRNVVFVGLGAMGLGMATNLVQKGFSVHGYDVFPAPMDKLEAAGGHRVDDPSMSLQGADLVILMVTSSDQIDDFLFGSGSAASALCSNAVIVVCSTVAPDFIQTLHSRLKGLGKNLDLVDAPVSGGTVRSAQGTLTIMAAGSKQGLTKAAAVLHAMAEKLFIIDGGVGAGSCVKMVNQLLAGVHITAAAEALALGAMAGLDTRQLYEIITHSAGTSWMFENRGRHMVENDFYPLSALNIFVKDMTIVMRQAQSFAIALPMAAASHQLYLFGAAAGFGRLDDAAVVKVFEMMAGVTVASLPPAVSDAASRQLPRGETLQSLPPDWSMDRTPELFNRESQNRSQVLIVLDDDPTGTQTVHGVNVLTEWSVESIAAEMATSPSCFFILTNSRALPSAEAAKLTKEICRNIREASGSHGYTIVLRGDSTLRGHFPEEADAVAEITGEPDIILLCPFFLQGGRYTINDVHYVADGDTLVPVGLTEFAKDNSFGFKSSNLKQWVVEKTGGKVAEESVASVSIDLIRKGGPEAVFLYFTSLGKGTICVVNAASETDIKVVAAGMRLAEKSGIKFLCRTAASFVSSRLGIEPKPPVTPKESGITKFNNRSRHGALIVVGSYVPKTTQQVEVLLSRRKDKIHQIIIDVLVVASEDELSRETAISAAAADAQAAIARGFDVAIITSRNLVTGEDASHSLAIGSRISSSLVEIVQKIAIEPRYILSKGGITSSDICTKALGAKKASVIGQALPGIPVWKLGDSCTYPGMPYIVFPGNVGGSSALADVVESWASVPQSTTAEILKEARGGSYAIGAFNVYNLEGVQAVVSGAEKEKSPAILQIHPASWQNGGDPLVAACKTAAMAATVPISVHLDHGNDPAVILRAIQMGFDSVMADGSNLSYNENVSFTKSVVSAALPAGILVEAELGRLSGTEDGLTVEEYDAKLTNVDQASDFISSTKIDALAVCIGNVHGKYPRQGPCIDIERLKALNGLVESKDVFLVLHGASGLPPDVVDECIANGVVKFNVNTEVREVYLQSIRTAVSDKAELLNLMDHVKASMEKVVVEKMRMFGSSGKALA